MPIYHPEDYRTLKRFGRLPNVELDDLDKLELHGRAAAVAAEIAQTHWCGCPDFADEEIAGSDPAKVAHFLGLLQEEAEDLVSMHEHMLLAQKSTSGTGSFPRGCHPDYPNRHAIRFHWDIEDGWRAHHKRPVTDAELQGMVNAKVWGLPNLAHAKERWAGKPVIEVAVDFILETFRRRGCIMVPESNPQRANCRLTSRPIPGGTIGLGWYNLGTCASNTEARMDANWQSNLFGYYRLGGHEGGHVHRLPHEFNNQAYHQSLMSYSWPRQHPPDDFRNGPPETTLPRDASIPRLQRYYGSEWVPPNPWWMGPSTPPPPDPGDIVDLTGELHVDGMAIRGTLTAGRKTSYFFVPSGGGVYIPQRRVF
jgi:hypothetical protein